MEQNNKYYKPELCEFIPGLVYESLIAIDLDNKTKELTREWEESIFNPFDWFEKDRISTILKINEDWVRVKYLDKGDVESLGVTINQHIDSINKTYFNVPSDPDWVFNVAWDKLEVWVYHPTNLYGFRGIIKNKSELVRILKMIGVLKYEN